MEKKCEIVVLGKVVHRSEMFMLDYDTVISNEKANKLIDHHAHMHRHNTEEEMTEEDKKALAEYEKSEEYKIFQKVFIRTTMLGIEVEKTIKGKYERKLITCVWSDAVWDNCPHVTIKPMVGDQVNVYFKTVEQAKKPIYVQRDFDLGKAFFLKGKDVRSEEGE